MSRAFESETRAPGTGIINGISPGFGERTAVTYWFQAFQFPPPYRFRPFWFQTVQFPYGRA